VFLLSKNNIMFYKNKSYGVCRENHCEKSVPRFCPMD
jgi:hypothetical protein